MTRRLLALAALLLVFATPAAAQPAPGDAEGVVKLTDGWLFARGDQPGWADPAFDDRAWTAIPVPGWWEAVFADHDGFGWYRRTVRLSAAVEGAPVGVSFGTVGDAFEAYWNGVPIGSRGSFPPRFVEGVDPTLFMVSPEALARRAGGEHVLAVRVFNDYAYGGLIGGVSVGPYAVLAQRRSPGDMVIGGLVSFFLAIGVYHFAFFLRRRAARENLYFALLTLGVSIYGATYATATSEFLLPYVNPYRVGLMALLGAGPFFVALVYDLFNLRYGRREQLAILAFPVLVVIAALLPLRLLAEFNAWIDAGLAVGMLALVVRAALASSPHRPHARTLVLGTAAFAVTFVYDLASEYDFVPVAQVLPGVSSLFWIGFLVFVVAVGIATAGKWALTEVTALVDPLTELSRRHVLEDSLRREVERMRRGGGSLALVMVDLDFFKQVNDAYGHRLGDEVLARVGRLLRSTARNIDLPARFGGEEFAVLLYDSTLDGALAFAERFRTNLREMRVPAPGGSVQVTASVGIAVGSEMVSAEALVEAADRALYRAKGEGRDRLVGVVLPAVPQTPAPSERRADRQA